MLNLVYNEWIKIFKRISTFLMIGMILLVVIASGIFMKTYEAKNTTPEQDWQSVLIAKNEEAKQRLAEAPDTQMLVKQSLEKEIAINEYRLKHDLPPQTKNSTWSFLIDSSSIITLVGLFTIVIAGGVVANEFSWGTIKLLLIRPISRTKILLSKYLTVLLFGICLMTIVFISAAVTGALLFGAEEGANIHLSYSGGEVVEKGMFPYAISTYLLGSIQVLMLTTMAFMISAVFRTSSLAIGVSIFLLLMGGTITNLIAIKFDWAKYSLFANTDLSQYIDGVPLVDGMTFSFSIFVLLAYFLIFHLLAFVVFHKRDVAA